MIDPDAPDGGLGAAAALVAAKHGDPLRIQYRALPGEALDDIATVKHMGTLLWGVIAEMKPSREQALALTNLQQAVFWATHAASAGSTD